MPMDPVTGGTVGTLIGGVIVTVVKGLVAGTRLDPRVNGMFERGHARLGVVVTVLKLVLKHVGFHPGQELAQKLDEITDPGSKP